MFIKFKFMRNKDDLTPEGKLTNAQKAENMLDLRNLYSLEEIIQNLIKKQKGYHVVEKFILTKDKIEIELDNGFKMYISSAKNFFDGDDLGEKQVFLSND